MGAAAPFWLAAVLMVGGGVLVMAADRRGRDFDTPATA
jgi:hypothetical protein